MTNDPCADREQQFRNRHNKTLSIQGIKYGFVSWYVLRAKSFIKAFTNRRLADPGPDDITAYLITIDREGTMKPWQFR